MEDQETRFVSEELLPERTVIFKRLTWSLLALIAATFVLMLWVLGSPDAYQEHAATQAPASTWPDGSAKTPGRPALAQQPATPSSTQPQQPSGG